MFALAGVALAAALVPASGTKLEPGEKTEEEYREELQDCWTFGGITEANPNFGPQLCCVNPPCGLKACWAPPEFTYAFCCEQASCKAAVIEGVRSALDYAVSLLPVHGILNSSQAAFRRDPHVFRKMVHFVKIGLRLYLGGQQQVCECAMALAAVALMQPGGAEGKMAQQVLSPTWLLESLHWADSVTLGWGGLFAFLAAPDGLEELPSDPDYIPPVGALANHLKDEQERAKAIAKEHNDWQDADLSVLLGHLRKAGVWQSVWSKIREDHAARETGRKCTALPSHKDGHGRWEGCRRWEYGKEADFSSPLPPPPAAPGTAWGSSRIAVCALGAPRNLKDTYTWLRQHVVETLQADTFVYVPFPLMLTEMLEHQLFAIGPAITAIAAHDVDRQGMQERLFGELDDPDLTFSYLGVPGPWRAPLFGQMGSSLWGYFNQHACKKMVEAYEEQRGFKYEWVVFSRADVLWGFKHPPVQEMDPKYVYIPWGQDNSHYDHGPEMGINDRHAVVPRQYFQAYFGRWEELRNGKAMRYLSIVKDHPERFPINTEQYLLLHLRAHDVQIRRFPPVAFVVHCAEGPQCQHLYKGTTLGKQRWTGTAKYWTELVEVSRSVKEWVRGAKRRDWGWIWAPLRFDGEPNPVSWEHEWRERAIVINTTEEPDKEQAKEVRAFQRWEYHTWDIVCCIGPSGPVTCSRLWPFKGRCGCVI